MGTDAEDYELKQAVIRSLTWGLTRLEAQHQAVLATMEMYQPDARAIVEEQLRRIREDGRIRQLFDAIRKDVVQAFDEVWLRRQGIDPNH